ncbi:cell envelope biogenesis protein OmpA [Massilia violaceinigra]|uniref:Cell envelope biogenesis protein OmpA n=1 Tax=Massilia violaceinigra TaxID=2045208 RepID=A0A2D2DNL3_9BURK|nr:MULTISPECIES: OmpA family protein [Massilia]ATQ76557.1 cell envelope biogenesis protein OmpA [Massilia violaceinigra]MDQ1921788.1 OmpA family protein [Massilia sp. CCM 9206]
MRHLVALLILLAGAVNAGAQTAAPQPGQVLVSGTVPDEASKAAVLARLREVYGADMVVDQITVGQVATPANWNGYVQKLITPDLKSISRGQLKIDGSTVSIKGEVASEETRQKIAGNVTASLNPTYTVNNSLRVSAADQNVLDTTLANRIVEFESGKATLTPAGRAILDEMAAAMIKLKDRKVDIIGHTDSQGNKATNQNLSQARAEAVKTYLTSSGIKAELLSASGQGADRPVASNDSADGRARNRRIEFRMAQ